MSIFQKTQRQLIRVTKFARDNKYGALYKNLPHITQQGLESAWEYVPAITINDFRKHSEVLSHYLEKEIRYLISEFDSKNADSLFLIPQKTDSVWDLLQQRIEKSNPKVAILVAPLFWQIGPLFYRTCRKNSTPVSVLNPRNLPLARQVIKETEAELVVTTPDVAAELFAILTDGGLQDQIKMWHLITPVGKKANIPRLSGDIVLEYHLFPGIPIGHTTPELIKKHPEAFFPNSEYFFEIKDRRCFLTSLKPHALPFVRLQIAKNAEKSTHDNKKIIKIHEIT